jgi:glyoxylase-like metal-dependent hydrolase (beta-lactamase superfamily II)
LTLERLEDGLWRWTAPHPDWTADDGGAEGWEREVGCVAWEAEDALVLIDPLVAGDAEEQQQLWTALDALASEHNCPVAIVLTVYWHERTAGVAFERFGKTLGATIWAHEGATGRLQVPVTNAFADGATLPGGIVATVVRPGEAVLWLPGPHTIVVGDSLLGRAGGLTLSPAGWLEERESLEDSRARLRSLLDLPVERVIVSHGVPVLAGGRDALAAALGA